MVFCWKHFRPLSALALLTAICIAPTIPTQAGEPPKPDRSGAAKPPTARTKSNAIDAELKAAIDKAPSSALWPDNNYARLLDLGNVTVKSDGTVVARYRMTYKLFNEQARQLAEVSLPYNSSYQSIHILNARTIKKDGAVQEVDPEDMRTTSPFSEYLMYDDAQAISFSMPGIEDNCVIDYTWEEITRPMLMPGQFTTYWGFSGPEPVGVSRYVLHVPAEKSIKFKVYNDDALKPVVLTSLDGKTKTYTWERRDIAPIEIEPSMPRMDDVKTWMEVSSLGSWQDVAHWFWGLQQPQAKPNAAIKATVADLIANKKTDEEKARAIYDWVANHTRYVGLEFGLSAFKPHAASDVHAKLYGDCKDKATLLITMLGLAGIKAHPVLLHAEERRLVDEGLPTLNAFNHCIALADVAGKEVWLDATAETCAYGDIPDGDRGVRALVVNEGKGEFKTIPIYQPVENGMDVTTHIAIRTDGQADTDIRIDMRGAAGQNYRAYIRSLTPEKQKQFVQVMTQKFSTGASLKDYKLADATEKEGPYFIKISSLAPNFAEKVGKSLLILPLELANSGQRANPYIQEKRVWPIVEEEAFQTRSQTIFTLPEGYSLEEMPEDMHLVGPLQRCDRTLVKSADGRTITVTTTILELPGKVAPGDYGKVQVYYNSLLKTANEKIVLKAPK
jgi:hypothetical protein